MTRGFAAPPAVRGYQGRLVELLEPLAYRDDHRGLGVTVPPGFVCDGASVPRWGWGWLAAGWVELLGPAVLHDWTYRRGATIVDLGRLAAVFSRGWADRIMVEAMAAVGCSARDQRKVRAALFVGARGSWKAREVYWRGDEAAP